MTQARFSPLQRAFHWVVANCILAMLFIGVGMVSTISTRYLTLVSIHKPLGATILVLAVLRLILRLRRGAPPLPAGLPPPMKLAAQLLYIVLYALIIMPLLGWAMLSAEGFPSFCPVDCACHRSCSGIRSSMPCSAPRMAI
jgi:cytochrome b561